MSILIALNESHVAVHTYADEGMLAVDIFTCGDKANSEGIFAMFVAWLKANSVGHSFTVARRTLPRFVKGLQWEGEYQCAYC